MTILAHTKYDDVERPCHLANDRLAFGKCIAWADGSGLQRYKFCLEGGIT